MKVCAGRLEDADLPSRSHSDGLKRQETVNQVTIQMLSVSVPANHRYASSNVLHVKLRFPLNVISLFILHVHLRHLQLVTAAQIPAMTRRQKT